MNSSTVYEKLKAKARYQRRYARHKAAPKSASYPAELRLTPRQKALVTIRGVPEYLQQFVRMRFGNKGQWGRGRYQHGTRKGPGRRPLGWTGLMHTAGTKLVKRFIRDAKGEQIEYRKIYARMTGKDGATV